MGEDVNERVAKALATMLHTGQTDKAGQPYTDHPRRVAAYLTRRWPDATKAEVEAAWLHDVLEDTSATPGTLKFAGISDEAISIVAELTRPSGLTYREWIANLAAHGSLSAIRVKIADNEDNSNPARVAALGPDGSSMVERRYRPARQVLEAALQERFS